MGCFNMSCGISGLPVIANDKVIMIPLIPTRRDGAEQEVPLYKYIDGIRTNIPFYYSTTTARIMGRETDVLHDSDIFSPMTLPIVGYYNDYGGIENVEENENTKLIEEYFGLSITQFVECVMSSRKSVGNPCDIPAQIFCDDKKLYYSYDMVSSDWLEKIGFEFKNGYYKHPDVDPFGVTLVNVVNESKKDETIEVYRIYRLSDHKLLKEGSFHENRDDFIGHWFTFTEHIPYLDEKMRPTFNIMRNAKCIVILYSVYEQLLAKEADMDLHWHEPWSPNGLYKKFEDTVKAQQNELEKLAEEIKTEEGKSILKDHIDYKIKHAFGGMFSGSYGTAWATFVNIYKEPCVAGKFKDEAIKMLSLRSIMYALNRFFFPVMLGSQDTPYKANKILADITGKIADDKIKERELDE